MTMRPWEFEHSDPPTVQESVSARDGVPHRWRLGLWWGVLIIGTILIFSNYRFIDVIFFWFLMTIDYKITSNGINILYLVDLVDWIIKKSKNKV